MNGPAPIGHVRRNSQKKTYCCILAVVDPGGSPPCLQDFFKIMQFSGNFRGKTPILSKFWPQGPPWGQKLCWAPLTKILDPCLPRFVIKMSSQESRPTDPDIKAVSLPSISNHRFILLNTKISKHLKCYFSDVSCTNNLRCVCTEGRKAFIQVLDTDKWLMLTPLSVCDISSFVFCQFAQVDEPLHQNVLFLRLLFTCRYLSFPSTDPAKKTFTASLWTIIGNPQKF